MILLKKLETALGDDIVVEFGIPDTPKELAEMLGLRYQVYRDRKYIDPNEHPNEIEQDEYDREDKCVYFIAKCNGKMIATIRLIKDFKLPTEKCFSFEEPAKIRRIDRSLRAELGRFIILSTKDCDKKTFLPRGLVMLIMFNVLSEYGTKNKIHGGYCFIKRKLEEKLEKRKFPFHRIKDYTLTIDKDHVLYNYFTNLDDPIIPIFYITEEALLATRKILENRLMFSEKENVFTLKNNLYTKALRHLGIL